MNEAVTVEGVHFAFPGGTKALAEVTATIRPGRVTGLVGPDGAVIDACGRATRARNGQPLIDGSA